jgi:hypothetical protein
MSQKDGEWGVKWDNLLLAPFPLQLEEMQVTLKLGVDSIKAKRIHRQGDDNARYCS